MDQRASLATNDTVLEEELTAAHEEITNMEKELKSLLTVTEFLFESQVEMQAKLESETASVEDSKREANTRSFNLNR